MTIGACGCSTVRMFFPAMYVPGPHTAAVTTAQAANLYNLAIRPSVESAVGNGAAGWPVTFKSELFRATPSTSNRPVASKYQVPATKGYKFFAKVLKRCEDEPKLAFARGAFFALEAKGEKMVTNHAIPVDNPPNPIPFDMAQAWAQIFDWLDLERWDRRTWEAYVDVAFEVEHPGHCLFWLKDAHGHMLSRLLGISLGEANQILAGWRGTVDQTSTLWEVAGLRANLGDEDPARERRQIVKANIYTTDKSHTYLLDSGRAGKFLPTKVALDPATGQRDGAVRAWGAGMRGVFEQCIESEVEGRARFEVRVHVDRAMTALYELQDWRWLREWMISVPAVSWW